eukprot:sb/3479122/
MSARMAICTKIGRKPKLVRIRYEKRGRLNFEDLDRLLEEVKSAVILSKDAVSLLSLFDAAKSGNYKAVFLLAEALGMLNCKLFNKKDGLWYCHHR